MAKSVFGEFAAFDTQGGIRFQKNNKLVSRNAVPPEVVAYLERHLGAEQPVVPRPVLTDEQKRQLREDSLKVAPGLEATPDKVASDAALAATAPPLDESDFEEPAPPVDPSPPQDEPPVDDPRLTQPVTTFESFPEPPTPETPKEPTTATALAPMPTDDDMSEFMESVSIHTASIEDIAEALFERFGIYTIWLKRLPANDEINPLTGEGFTRYHMGIAYQAAIRAQNRGLFDLDPAHSRKMLDEGRHASEHVSEQFQPQAVSVAENRRADSFAYRTSPMGTRSVAETEIVHEKDETGQLRAVQRPIIQGEPSDTGLNNGAGVRYNENEDEPLVEPNFSGKPVIRPSW